MDPDLDYPELLALWRTVPPEWRRRCRKHPSISLAAIQDHKPGLRLTYWGKPTRYVHKGQPLVAVGPALAVILDRPELAALKGGGDLEWVKESWEYERNREALGELRRIDEACLGYQFETVEVSFIGTSNRRFRVRTGCRGHALRAIEQVLEPGELDAVWGITFRDGDDGPVHADLAADPQYWP
jgi:hypothetical protein